MKTKTTNTKVGEMDNNLKLKAQSLKRQLISRFQLLIIYINSMTNKTNKKAGKGNYGHYGHPTAIVGGKRVLRGLKKVGVAGISEVGLPKIDVGLTKSYIKSCIRRVGGIRVESLKSKFESRGLRLRTAGLMFAAVFLAVLRQAQNKLWAVMPASRAEAAFNNKF